MSLLQIPTEYSDKLDVAAATDERSDENILESLNRFTPVTSEKNIWTFWHSGLLSMPVWCQRNAIDWVRICGPEWTIRVVDNDPDSPNYVMRYISADLLPRAFVERRMDGKFHGQHSADMVRTAALFAHGGAWMDVGNVMTRHIDRICWDELEDPESPHQVAIMLMFGQMIVNYFVAARKGDPFIKRWHDLFLHVWGDRTNHSGILSSPLLAPFLITSYDPWIDMGISFDFKEPPVVAAEYITQCYCFRRVASLEDAGDGFSGVEYWEKNIMLLDCINEGWSAEAVVGFGAGGQAIFDLLSLRRDGDTSNEQYKMAEKLVWSVLGNSSMMKITKGGDLMNAVLLGTLWDRPENVGKDREPGTFAELLRYGSVHFRQTREVPLTRVPEKPETTLKKGLLEL
jgi:hypothetical protein